MKKATVAIITRTKDRPLLFSRAIDSILNQRFKNWIHIIINDGGASEPVDELIAQKDSEYAGRVNVIHHPESKGMEAASNAGIEASESKYVVIHDDDDSWHPGFLEKTVQYMESLPDGSPIAGVVSGIERVHEVIKGEHVIETSREVPEHLIRDLSLWQLCQDNLFSPIAFLYRRNAYEVIGGVYDESLPVQGDWEFNTRFLMHFDIGHIPDVLAYYHHRESGSASPIYDNTVTEQVPLHTRTQTMLRNRTLREDLANGRFGKGVLLALAHSASQQAQQVHTLDRHIDQRLLAIENTLNVLDQRQQEDIAHLTHAKELAEKAARDANHLREAVCSSTSWKITAPIRYLKRLFAN